MNSCQKKENNSANVTSKFKIDFEKFTLDNGLQVILHVDKSDPVVAAALTAHVGSAREIPGRTGFAHLFEHLLFLDSENLGKGGLDKLSAKIGGAGASGTTSRDRTNYFQTVPKDALEKMIWAQSDKLGFFINTVTAPVLAKEKQVVKNERKQAVDNRPYGHTPFVIGKYLYPENHPYSWQVIGSVDDLQNATLQDVKDFYNKWYKPNNVILTITGDIDIEKTKEWVHKYFDEIKGGVEIPKTEKQAANLKTTKKLYHEDNFARLPQLTLTFPSVYEYHPDEYALEILTSYLSEGKNAPLNKSLIDEKQITSDVKMFNRSFELAGEIHLQVRAFENTELDEVKKGIDLAFAEFEKNGISNEDLKRIKAGKETEFYQGWSSVLGKGFKLAKYDIFTGDPGYISTDINNLLAVRAKDVKEVFNKYIKDKPFVAASFVPKGEVYLMLSGSVQAEIKEEEIVDVADEIINSSQLAKYEKTPTLFDRTIEPPYGEAPIIMVPEVWKERLSSGVKIYGIADSEIPLVQLKLTINGGLVLEKLNEKGMSNLLAQFLIKGTLHRSTADLEIAFQKLGADIRSYATNESIVFEVTTLARNYNQTIKLLTEIILQPRWDHKELSLLKQNIISRIQQESVNTNSIARNEFRKLVYGDGHLLSFNNLGTEQSVKNLFMEDLKTFYETNIAPNVTTLQIVGDISRSDVIRSMEYLDKHWTPKEIDFPAIPESPAIQKSKVYFYNIPDAKQTTVKVGYAAMSAMDDDFYPAQIMNYRLGGGGFTSDLTQVLRESKGYTYRIVSRFTGTKYPGTFNITSNVRSNVTYESAELIKDIMARFSASYTEEDLNFTRSSMIKSNARAFETMNSKLNMLSNISNYGFSDNYVNEREKIVENMSLAEIKKLGEKYLVPDKMIYLFVGDAKSQLKKLEALGYGKPILLNEVFN